MKTMLKTLILATGLAGAGALAYAQEEPTAPNGEGETMMQEGEGGMSGGDMSGMMKTMDEMKPMMEACTKMMSAMADGMDKGETPAPKG